MLKDLVSNPLSTLFSHPHILINCPVEAFFRISDLKLCFVLSLVSEKDMLVFLFLSHIIKDHVFFASVAECKFLHSLSVYETCLCV